MSFRRLALLASILSVMGGLAAADAPSPIPYASFHLVRTRNIFDPDRRPMVVSSGPAAPRPTPPPASASDFVALTGTLVTGDKAFAFFTGSRAEFNAVLAVSGTVANMRITEITPLNVKVSRGGKPIVIAVGQQLPLNGSTPVATVVAPVPDSTSAPAPGSAPATGPAADQSDIVRRMMERRQKETAR